MKTAEVISLFIAGSLALCLATTIGFVVFTLVLQLLA